jgi:hypothetical protein
MSNGGLQTVLLFSDRNIVNKAAINKIKTNYSNNLQYMVLSNVDFKVLSSTGLVTNLGSPSLPKFASTWAKVNSGNTVLEERLISTLTWTNHT